MAAKVFGGCLIPLLAALLAASIIPDVRSAASTGDFAGAERLIAQYQKQHGNTPESVEAYSWLARNALAAKRYKDAERYAAETKKRVLAQANAATLDREDHLPIALGAAIEVQGQVLAAREDRSSAVAYLNRELDAWRNTSIRTRIQKNINLLSLEGKKAPPLEGVQLPRKPVLLFFWAHWCPDCKAMAPEIAQLQREFPGLVVIGPTQLYGYAQGGQEAGPREERAWLASAQQRFYGAIHNMPAPVSEQNFKVYGASSTPTIVLVDAAGIVRLYHPGRMTASELRPYIRTLSK